MIMMNNRNSFICFVPKKKLLYFEVFANIPEWIVFSNENIRRQIT